MHSAGSVRVSWHNRKALALQKGKKANSSGLTADFTLKEADTVFGRPSEWTTPVADIETGLRLDHRNVSIDSYRRSSHCTDTATLATC